ncbi:MAG: hypothetical protein K2M43_01590 [Mycoplasmoidaceae bacterium]|nr:hypothetical protein [Mycoplasmoidaceae bacterium]
MYELQQSSDVTFRLYDYDRQKTDPSRKLHINESLVNTKVPFTKPKYISNKNCLIKTDAFEMYKISNSQGSKTYTYKNAK